MSEKESSFDKGVGQGMGFGCGCLLFFVAIFAVLFAIGAIGHAVNAR